MPKPNLIPLLSLNPYDVPRLPLSGGTGRGYPSPGATAMYDKLIERASKRNVMLGIGAVVVLAVIAIWIAL